MSHGKQFTLYSHKNGPNGWKVAIVLEELGLTYETIYLDFQKNEQKAAEYTKFNPNGRIPTIIDHHNDDFTLWESAAILTYLTDKYDPERKISTAADKDKYHQLKWLAFQISGQGPYYGQAFWFARWHPEKLPSAIERYKKEMLRVMGVLDGVLAGQEWLVGGKPSIADFAFITWNETVTPQFLGSPEEPFDIEKAFPHYYAWNEKLHARPSATKIRTVRAEVNKP